KGILFGQGATEAAAAPGGDDECGATGHAPPHNIASAGAHLVHLHGRLGPAIPRSNIVHCTRCLFSDHRMLRSPRLPPIDVGAVRLPDPVILARMSGVTDMPFRRMVKQGGAGLVVSEMIASAAMVRENRKTLLMAKNSPEEFPMA